MIVSFLGVSRGRCGGKGERNT
jgi:hypothetical protein